MPSARASRHEGVASVGCPLLVVSFDKYLPATHPFNPDIKDRTIERRQRAIVRGCCLSEQTVGLATNRVTNSHHWQGANAHVTTRMMKSPERDTTAKLGNDDRLVCRLQPRHASVGRGRETYSRHGLGSRAASTRLTEEDSSRPRKVSTISGDAYHSGVNGFDAGNSSWFESWS